MFDKAYDPKTTEERIYKLWERSGYFNPDKLPGKRSKNYIVYMPLPNVTGTLHMGHALDNTLQDIVIRYHRLKGFKTLWFPGTDHAGIATQYVIEKELKKQGTSRFRLGREKFVEKAWEWKNRYGDIILEQLKKLGASADWSRTRFTMDKEYSKDVMETFIHYHKRGWIYRGLRTVNWCPRCATSLSELELEYEDEKTILYYIKYGPFTLATVRPETKFGDTALAVHPDDKRYKKYIGKTLEVESLNTKGALEKPEKAKIKLYVVGDEAVDPKFGTGVIKVTPAHDIADFEIGERHKLAAVQVIDAQGKMNAHAGKYAGLKVKEAREKVAADLKAVGLMEKEEPYEHRVAKCYRCGTVIEPLPSKQWFLKMDALAKQALKAVRAGKVKITPQNFERPYFNWLENIRDWTVSRQIWWGHRLPVFFCRKKLEESSISNFQFSNTHEEKFVVSIEKPKKCSFCKKCEMEQSQDVLDTWFSSALWPFAGLSKTDLKKYYPGNTLITARDILNPWVARMIFSGLEFHKKVPFTNVFIHGTILTKEGKRMSKSLGTGIDPLKYIENYGADATRFGVVWQASGQDIRWDESAIVAGKKFANKLWNITRYVLTKSKSFNPERQTLTATDKVGKELLKKLDSIKEQVESDIETFNFSRALHTIYDFTWHEFADKYIEYSKNKEDEETKNILSYVLLSTLKLLHPFMPYVTEEIYQKLPLKNKDMLMVESW